MKTVVNSAQVAHLWANQSQDTARNSQGNFYFDGPVIFSYGSHWPLAVFSPWKDENGQRIVFTNGGRYGNTTARHERHVSTALRGHPLRIVDVPTGDVIRTDRGSSALGVDAARALSAGNVDALRDVIATLHAAGVAAFTDSLTRRSDDRIAWQLDTAADHFNLAAELAALPGFTAAQRKALTAAVGERPAAMPAAWREPMVQGYGHYYATPVGNLRGLMKEAREAHKRATALAKMPALLRDLRHAWGEARDTGAAASMRQRAATRAATYRGQLDRLARVAGATLARNLPTPATIAALVDKLAPYVAAEHGTRDAKRFAESLALALRCYGQARHMGRGNSRERASAAILRRTLSNGGRYEYQHLPPLSGLMASAERVLSRDVTAETMRELVAAQTGRGTGAGLARAALAELDAIATRARDALTPVYAYVARREMRDTLELYTSQTRVAVLAAQPADASADTLQRAIAAHETLEKAYADARVLGVPFTDLPGPYGASVAPLRERIATAAVRDMLATASRAADRVHALAVDAIGAVESGFLFSAQHAAQDASGALDHARGRINAARAAIDASGATLESMRLELLQVSGHVEASAPVAVDALNRAAALRESLIADTGLLPGVAVPLLASICWRAGDPNAPRPSVVAFRLMPDGETVESSLGARVSVKAARRLWALIRATVNAGRPLSWAYGCGPAVGPFRVSRIGADGSAVVGCHDITASEARLFARAMQWPPFGDTVTPEDALPVDVHGSDAAA